eukprot:130996-Rhodomonas_salina.1
MNTKEEDVWSLGQITEAAQQQQKSGVCSERREKEGERERARGARKRERERGGTEVTSLIPAQI